MRNGVAALARRHELEWSARADERLARWSRVTRRSRGAVTAFVMCVVLIIGCGREAARRETPDDAHATHVDSTTVEAAVAVVRDYYAAIDAGDYRAAYLAWSNEGAATGQSYTQFAGGFQHTKRVVAELGPPGGIDAAAGSRFVEVPVTIRAENDRGETERYRGNLVLRRSEVDGATPAQRRWHIYTASVKRTP